MRRLYHFLLSFIGSFIYGNPSKEIIVIGVTGTKGKSTTIELLNAIFSTAGEKTALLSSVSVKIGDKSSDNTTGNTMPGRFVLQKFLRDAVSAGCKYAIIEVTSEGVVQHRHRFIEWDVAILTNLAREHIERHGSFEAYRSAKVAFFASLKKISKNKKYALINGEDENRSYFEKAVSLDDRITTIHFLPETIFKGEKHFNNKWLTIPFNMENAAAAVACARIFNIENSLIHTALEKFKGLPGRMEFVQENPFAVVVDYAHTSDSLKAVYETLLSTRPKTRLICVLGSCGGGRDVWKRPVMGRIAGEYCSEIILTNEDPFDDDPMEIIKDIEKGVREKMNSHSSLRTIIDRGEAIRDGIKSATTGDTVIITGKGSEKWIRVAKNKKIPWSDVLEARKYLEK